MVLETQLKSSILAHMLTCIAFRPYSDMGTVLPTAHDKSSTLWIRDTL